MLNYSIIRKKKIFTFRNSVSISIKNYQVTINCLFLFSVHMYSYLFCYIMHYYVNSSWCPEVKHIHEKNINRYIRLVGYITAYYKIGNLKACSV